MSRTRNSAWTLSSRVIFAVVTTLVGAISTPWLLRWLGNERMGAYKILIDWFGYLALFELGLSGSVMACLASAAGKRDNERVVSVLSAAIRIYAWITGAMLLTGFVLIILLPHLITVRTLPVNELRMAALVLLMAVGLTPFSIFRALAEAQQRGYFTNLLQIVQSFLLIPLLLGAAWAGWGLAGQCLANVTTQVPTALVLGWLGFRRFGRALFKQKPDPEVRKAIWGLNWPTLVNNITGKVSLISDNLIIGWWMGPAAVVPFFLTQRLATLAQSQLEGIGTSTWAGLTELHAQGLHQSFKDRLFELTGLTSGLFMVMLAPIAAFNQHFINRWVGPSLYAGDLVNLVSCSNMWFWSLFSFWGWILCGTGQLGRWIPYAVAFAIVNVTVSVVGTIKIGLAGPIIGTLVSFVLVNAWAMPKVLGDIFHISAWELWRTAIEPLSWGLPYAIVVWFIAQSYTPQGWLGLLASMSLAGLGGLALWLIFGMTKDTRMIWRGRIRIALGT